METSRLSNSVRNTFFGTIYKIISLFCPFFIRTIMLQVLGAEYLGLNSLFTSILMVLSLSELGFGSAMVFSMYEPLAKNETETVCALLNLYRRIYRIIGIVILVIGLCISPFLKFFISGTIPPDMNLYLLFYIYLLNTVVSYFLFAYKTSLLSANQREDVISKVSSVTSLVMYILQIVVLLVFKNYYCYVIILPLMTMVTNILQSQMVDKLYPQYKCRGNLPKSQKHEIYKKVSALVGHRLSGTVILSADNIVISAFLGLTMLANYNNYYLIITAITGFFTIFYNAIRPSIGNSIVKESKDKNYLDFEKITFIVAWAAGWCTVCLLCLYQPFMTLWVGSEYLLPFSTVVWLSVYFFVWRIQDAFFCFKDAAGMWWEDRFRPYIVATLNVIINIVLVKTIGLNGVIISTFVVLFFITDPWVLWVLFKKYFCRSPWRYCLKLAYYTIVTIMSYFITSYLISFCSVDGYIGFVIVCVICFVVPNVLFLGAYFRMTEFRGVKGMVRGVVKRKY